MLYETHLLLRGYFHTKNEMITVNIADVIEQTRLVYRQTDNVKAIQCTPPNNYIVQGV